MSAAPHGRRGEWWGELSTLPRCYVPSSFFFWKYVHVRRSQKGDLNSGAVRYVVVCCKTPDPFFCIMGAFLPLPKAHFVS